MNAGQAASVPETLPAVVVGGGQAGLSISHFLSRASIEHVVFERARIANAWRSERWDSFCLVTPNWQCRLPDFSYAGTDPDGFMPKDEIVAYVEAFARKIEAPVLEGIGVRAIRSVGGGFEVVSERGPVVTQAVFMATGGYQRPRIPRDAERLPAGLCQLHSSAYRSPDALPEGGVLVVGSGQSGCQIAEDLHLAGRRVHLAVGSAPRAPRVYRGRDSVAWLEDMGQYDLPIDQHPQGRDVRRKANHYMTGRDGGHAIDLRQFAQQGMRLHGRLASIAGATLTFNDDLEANLDGADATYVRIQAMIDAHIEAEGLVAPTEPHYEPVWRPTAAMLRAATSLDLEAEGIGAVVWCTGFARDYGYVDLPAFDGAGEPVHERGVTPVPGFYFVGLPWLYTWGSGRFGGVARDAEYVVDHWLKGGHKIVPDRLRDLANATA